MRTRNHPSELGFLAVAGVVAGLDLLLEAIGLVVRYYQSGVDGDLGWRFDAGVVLPALLLALLYAAGLRNSSKQAAEHSRIWRHFAFFSGLAIVLLALESPFDAIADGLFVAHQLQHMTLAMIVPLLIVLAEPQAMLLRGLPRAVRRSIVRSFFGSRLFSVLRMIAHPAVATLLYIGINYFWMLPRIHDFALENEPIHDLLHATLLAAGLIFFWRGLDPRPYPLGPSLGARLFMFWLAAMSDILLGSFLAFKSVSLYLAYGPSPHLFGISALDDELYGGLTMWIPGGGMFAFATVLAIRRMASDEERRTAHLPDAVAVTTAESFARQHAANRKMALGLAAFAVVVVLITIATAVLYHYATSHALLALR